MFNMQGATQVTQVLDQVPGVQISYPGGSANGASTGAITFPNIRNGLSYETATLIDGHPLSVGLYGDYVTTFLNPALLQSAEVIKGPGAMPPEENYAINGTVNFRTKDPTPNAVPFFSAGATNTGGSVYSLGVSDTILSGRLGFVVGLAGYNEISWLNNAPAYFDPGTGSGDIGPYNTYPYACNGIGGGSATPLIGTNPKTFYSRVYNGCSAVATTTVSSEFDSLAQLFKLKYKLGNNTSLTGSFFGSQTTSNQSGNTSAVIPSIFQPGAGYAGSLKAGSVVDVLSAAYDGQPQFETNNEPIFQLELNTSFANNDTMLARFYHATISRIQMSGNPDPLQPYPQFTNIFGTLTADGLTAPFNGSRTLIDQYNYFNAPEIDQLTGYTLEYTHPFGTNNELTASADYTNAASTYSENEINRQSSPCYTLAAPNSYCYQTDTVLPGGSGQSFLTGLIRDREQFSSKFSGTFGLYENIYHSSYPTNCANDTATDTFCLPNGTLTTFTGPNTSTSKPVNYDSTTLHQMVPRMGLEWRPHRDLAVRFSAGSSIAPPFLYDLSRPNGAITAPAQAGPGAVATQIVNSGNLRPETAFGYNLGADYAFNDQQTFARADVYETNLFGQFLNETYIKGLCPTSICGPGVPLQVSQYINLSNARYEGIELSLRRIPRGRGFGFVLQGSTQRGYAYNLPSNFYCGFTPTKGHPCNQSTYDANLNIVAGQNYQGEYINNKGSLTSGVDNQSVPYLQGSAQINYHLNNGAFALFGETLLGKNNSFNRPPFGIAFASINYPINSTISIQASGTNIFNTYSGVFPVWGGGVTVPLVNGLQAGTNGNVLGPARYTFQLIKTFGSNQPPIQSASRASSH
jgi:hypothetical protein